MNIISADLNIFTAFLNGVCRHELRAVLDALTRAFLNGVCRHKPVTLATGTLATFLNGVCRHERHHFY